jgi:hypothetical protein
VIQNVIIVFHGDVRAARVLFSPAVTVLQEAAHKHAMQTRAHATAATCLPVHRTWVTAAIPDSHSRRTHVRAHARRGSGSIAPHTTTHAIATPGGGHS